MQPKPTRPTGVTILGVLAILAGLGGLIGGAALLGLSGLVASTYPGGATVAAAIGAILLIIGILELVYGIGFFGGKGWAWTLAMIGSVLNIVFGIVSIVFGSVGSVFGLIISILILYYLTRPHVKAYFGKGPSMMGSPSMPPSGMGSMPMGSMGSGQPMGSMGMGMTCKNCGASIPAGATRCPSCGAAV
jgi:zinc-ribbon domain